MPIKYGEMLKINVIIQSKYSELKFPYAIVISRCIK